eukprot:3564022-Alexandrium_andersonii.AAC.1
MKEPHQSAATSAGRNKPMKPTASKKTARGQPLSRASATRALRRGAGHGKRDRTGATSDPAGTTSH